MRQKQTRLIERYTEARDNPGPHLVFRGGECYRRWRLPTADMLNEILARTGRSFVPRSRDLVMFTSKNPGRPPTVHSKILGKRLLEIQFAMMAEGEDGRTHSSPDYYEHVYQENHSLTDQYREAYEDAMDEITDYTAQYGLKWCEYTQREVPWEIGDEVEYLIEPDSDYEEMREHREPDEGRRAKDAAMDRDELGMYWDMAPPIRKLTQEQARSLLPTSENDIDLLNAAASPLGGWVEMTYQDLDQLGII